MRQVSLRSRRGLALVLALIPGPLWAGEVVTLAGHGGPVRTIEVAADGAVITAGFDNALGLWTGGSVRWLDGHEAGVNATLAAPDGRTLYSGGDDFTLRQWDRDTGDSQVIARHQGKIASIAVARDGVLATASWDGSIGLMKPGAAPRFLWGHRSNVTAVAFAKGGAALYSASSDGTIRLWDTQSGQGREVLRHGFGVNTLLLDEDAGWLAYGALDGGTRVVALEHPGETIADLTLERRPVLAMALSPDRQSLAVGDGEGYIMVVDTGTWRITRDFRAAARGPVWALHYSGDGETLLSAGLDNTVYGWPVSGDVPRGVRMAGTTPTFQIAPDEMSNGERQFQRKCSVCHVLQGDTARRAGPTLEGLFGREVGTVADYIYSPALMGAGFAWSEETIDALFDQGPEHYLPGTKMPMQRITGAQDRKDLIDFLRAATTPPND